MLARTNLIVGFLYVSGIACSFAVLSSCYPGPFGEIGRAGQSKYVSVSEALTTQESGVIGTSLVILVSSSCSGYARMQTYDSLAPCCSQNAWVSSSAEFFFECKSDDTAHYSNRFDIALYSDSTFSDRLDSCSVTFKERIKFGRFGGNFR